MSLRRHFIPKEYFKYIISLIALTLLFGCVSKAPVNLTIELDTNSPRTGEQVTLLADTNAPDVWKVSFYQNGTLLGADVLAPFQYAWVAEAGSHTLRAVAEGSAGQLAEASMSVQVGAGDGRTPLASFVTDPVDGSGPAPLSIGFDASNTADPDHDADELEYSWDFGDGDSAEGITAAHVYTQVDDYRVVLTVRDPDGNVDSAAFTVSVVPTPTKQVAMPIEVLGKDRVSVTREFTLKNAAAANRLALTCHRCDYRDSGVNAERGAKASVRVNGGSWIDVTDEVANVAYPESAYGGIIGAYHTVRFTLPVTGFVTGDNRVEFRFNGTDGFTNGYRIINFNVLDESGNPQLTDRDLQWDDPTSWSPPLNSANDIRLGEELWSGRVALQESPLSQDTIRASCADCHSTGGEDLKYFNYSSETISERAQFHGLSKLQGDRIASYIRSLDTPAPKQARPWNPPYQPGPGLDSKPAEEWAAGAGLKWVLDDDADMLPYLFPNGTSKAEIAKVTSTRSTLNAREQPIALLLPDWKMWLPEVHPKDIWGDGWDDLADPDFSVEDAFAALRGGEAERMRSSADAVSKQELIDFTDRFAKTIRGTVGGVGGPQPCKNESIYNSAGFKALSFSGKPDNQRLATDPWACETLARSVLHTLAVKSWELHQRFGLEDAAPDLYPYGEARSWLGSQRAVFGMAPHRSGNDSKRFLHLTQAESSYLSHAWYQLQVILNAGNRNPQNHRPPDWKYQMSWLWANRRDNDVPSSLRYVQTLIKMQQNLDMRAPVNQAGGAPDVPGHYPFLTDRGPTSNGWWATTHVAPWRMVSIGGSFFNVGEDQARIWRDLDDVQGGLRVKVQNVLLKDWLDKTESYDVAEFSRGGGQNTLSPSTEVPTPYSGSGRVSDSTTDHNGIYRSIPMMRDFGVDEALLKRLIDWSELAWPRGDWDALR